MTVRTSSALLTLAAIWGASFLFMRIATPEFGVLLTAQLRVAVAALTLFVIVRWRQVDVQWRKRWRAYGTVGLLNAALPFVLICAAELHITASMAAILNATTPLFTVLVAYAWQGEAITRQKLISLFLGIGGVVVLVGLDERIDYRFASLSLFAAVAYALAGVYSARHLQGITPLAIAFGQQLMATVMLLPFSLWAVPTIWPSMNATISVVLLGVFCTAIAYLLFFYLIQTVGAVKTLVVTLLVPIFGVVWGAIFLAERLTWQNAIGLVMITSSIIFINYRKK